MATINLGNIKFNWKGTYNAGTAYAVDDVVSYNGSSYVCIQASTNNLPTVTAYWDIMSQKGTNGTNGTNGTDLTSTLTTQGDILFRDGSGLQRLGYGTSGKVLTTKGSGQNPTWETAVGGKIGQVIVNTVTARQSSTSSSWQDIPGGFQPSITPSATSSKILWQYHLQLTNGNHYGKVRILYGDDSFLTTSAIGDASGSRLRVTSGNIYSAGDEASHISMMGIDSPNTTSATTYKLQWRMSGGELYLNRSKSDSDNNEWSTSISTITLMEVLA